MPPPGLTAAGFARLEAGIPKRPPLHRSTGWRPAPPKVAAAFYLSPEWRGLIGAIIKQRGRRCQRCGRTGCRIFGDHVIELKDGGAPLDPANLQLLCGSCHTLKSNEAKRHRGSAE